MADRVLAASRMMQMQNISVHDAANFLLLPNLPPRIIEAVLMFLPKIDEPGAVINLLLAPVFMESDLARTAIFSVKSVLPYLTEEKVTEVLLTMVPPDPSVTTEAKAPRVTVFKELVRLFGEFLHFPRLATVFTSLWTRSVLHKDVRITLLQTALALLSNPKKEVAEIGWEIAISCAKSEVHSVGAGMVLAMVVRGAPRTGAEEKALVPEGYFTYPQPPYFSYSYGELVTNEIPYKISSRYLIEVLIPLLFTLLSLLRATPNKKSKEYEEQCNLLKHTCRILSNGWIQPNNAEETSKLLGSLTLETAVDPDALLVELHPFLVSVLSQCVAMSCAEEEDAPVPDSWKTLLNIFVSYSNAFFDSSLPISVRRLGESRMQRAQLSNSFLPREEMRSTEFKKQATLSPFEALPPSQEKYYWETKWRRRLASLTREEQLLVSLERIPETHPEKVKAQEAVVFSIANELVETLIRNSFLPPTSGLPALEESAVLAHLRSLYSAMGNRIIAFNASLKKIYDSPRWCEDVPGFSAWRMSFRFSLLKMMIGFFNGENLASFLRPLLTPPSEKSENYFFFENQSEITSSISTLLQNLKASEKALADWNERVALGFQIDPAPEHDSEGLKALRGTLEIIGNYAALSNFSVHHIEIEEMENEEYDRKKRENAYIESFTTLANSDILFLLEKIPALAIRFLTSSPYSTAFSAWVNNIEGAMKRYSPFLTTASVRADAKLLIDDKIGLAALRPLLKKACDAAKRTNFFKIKNTTEEDDKDTTTFMQLARTNTHLMCHIDPAAVRTYFSYEQSTYVYNSLIPLLVSTLGQASPAILYEALIDDWLDDLDFAPLGTLRNFRLENAVNYDNLFRMDLFLHKEEGTLGTLVQSEESKERRKALVSVSGVAKSFINYFRNSTNEGRKTFVARLKAKPSWGITDTIAALFKAVTTTTPEPTTTTTAASTPSEVVSSIVHLGKGESKTKVRTIGVSFDLVRSLLSSSSVHYALIYLYNPYLYFRILARHLSKDEAPLHSTNLVSQFSLPFYALVSSEPIGAAEQITINTAVPLKYLINIAEVLVRDFAPSLVSTGRHRSAASVRMLALRILQDLQSSTAACQYNPGRPKNAVLDALVLEAAEEVGEEMVVVGFGELVREIEKVGDASTLATALYVQENVWQLRWKKTSK